MVRYGEFGRGSIVGVKECLTTNSPNTVHSFCSGQVERIRVCVLGGGVGRVVDVCMVARCVYVWGCVAWYVGDVSVCAVCEKAV